MTKYFSVDVSNDIHIINLCETLEQARETCLAGAVEAHEFADDMDEYENYESNDLPYAVYGVVLGKAECKKKTLTEEEKDERYSDFDYSTVYNNRSNWGFFKVAGVRGWRIYKTDLDKIRQKQIWCLANRLYHAVRAAYSIV